MTIAFVLLSGGIDSTTCLHHALKHFDVVEAISVDYGQRHVKEAEYAARTCTRHDVRHTVIKMPNILEGNNVMLTDKDVEIPDIDYADIKGVSPTYVPFRNGTLLSIITAHAQKWVMEEIQEQKRIILTKEHPDEVVPVVDDQRLLEHMRDVTGVYFGAHAEDAHNWAYPDCTPEFIGSMANAIYTGTYYTVRLHTPLMTLGKRQIILLGEELGVDWANTWSCYAGGENHCGTCPTCRARKQGFIDAKVEDPTPYDK